MVHLRLIYLILRPAKEQITFSVALICKTLQLKEVIFHMTLQHIAGAFNTLSP